MTLAEAVRLGGRVFKERNVDGIELFLDEQGGFWLWNRTTDHLERCWLNADILASDQYEIVAALLAFPPEGTA